MTAMPDDASRAPTREEVESKVGDLHNKLAELKRAQSDLERERTALEETRRRQAEFTTGRQEVVHNLTRGIGLLEESEFAARRDAEQLARTLDELRLVMNKVSEVNEQLWTKDNFQIELTRANTVIENARLEWNTARLKWPVLSGETPAKPEQEAPRKEPGLLEQGFGRLALAGLALTWPVLLGIGALIATLLLR